MYIIAVKIEGGMSDAIGPVVQFLPHSHADVAGQHVCNVVLDLRPIAVELFKDVVNDGPPTESVISQPPTIGSLGSSAKALLGLPRSASPVAIVVTAMNREIL